MPQTREHLGILSLLNISEGIIVVTKKDMVDEDWLEIVWVMRSARRCRAPFGKMRRSSLFPPTPAKASNSCGRLSLP